MTVMFICTGRGSHDPLTVWTYNGPVPVPEEWTAYSRKSVMDLLCDRALGGCGRAPRLSSARLRALIEAMAAANSQTFDISLADL